jgi:hypothetical protein
MKTEAVRSKDTLLDTSINYTKQEKQLNKTKNIKGKVHDWSEKLNSTMNR